MTTPVVTIVANDVGGVGGMERHLQELVEGLLERGVRVVVVSRTLDLAPHPFLSWCRIPGPSRPFVLAYPWFVVVASLVTAWQRKGVLHVTGAIVANGADVCVVHYLHNRPGLGVLRARRSTLPYRVNAVAAAALSRFGERLAYRSRSRTRRLVAVSEPLRDEIVTAFPDRGHDVLVIPNAVDLHRFRPDPEARQQIRELLGLSNDDRVALFVGSEWQGKGLQLAVEALAQADAWHLIVVGSGDQDALTRRAADRGLEARVHLVGESHEPERYFATADAFVLPSVYETFSLAALEAAAAGLPVVATDVGVVSALAAAGGAVLVERHPDAIAAALRRLTEAPEEARRIGERAHEFARGFDWAAVVESYLGLYNELSAEERPMVTHPVDQFT